MSIFSWAQHPDLAVLQSIRFFKVNLNQEINCLLEMGSTRRCGQLLSLALELMVMMMIMTMVMIMMTTTMMMNFDYQRKRVIQEWATRKTNDKAWILQRLITAQPARHLN